MHAKPFDKLYSNSSLRKRIRSLAFRYFRAYPGKFDILCWDVDDIEQELWIRIYEGETTNPDLIVNGAVKDMFDILRTADRDVRAIDEVDLWNLAYEDDSGNVENGEDVMDRMVCHEQASYV